jgi:ABC-type transport system involved in cytochrome c biogenesis permease component
MKGMLILAAKDLRLLWRDRFGLFWVLGFPLIMALLFG